MMRRKQPCPKDWVARKLKLINDATSENIVWLEDLVLPGPEKGCVWLVERKRDELGAAPSGCTCEHVGRDAGHHEPACGLLKPEPEPKPAPKTEKTTSAAKPAASSTKKPARSKKATASSSAKSKKSSTRRSTKTKTANKDQ
jgi:hypothetical protein